tara:strand:- start:224659 stop:225207 length:549 start_codon:yes stop_codon:yes gene_type:complete
MESKSVIISEGERPIWQKVIAALFYTFSIFFIYYFFYTFKFNVENELTKRPAALIELAIYCFLFGFGFSSKNTKFFNLKDEKYKNQYSVGPIKVGKWKALPMLEYVSVFKNGRDVFEINVWYKRNKHFNIYNYHDEEESLETAYYIANQLNIKLLDATEKNNYKYLDMVKLKDKYHKPESSN